MGWYTFAKNFDERNIINHKIIYLEDLSETMLRLSKLVFQSGKNTKIANYNIVSDKKITSYPVLRDLLIKADACALDNPWKFAGFCEEAAHQIEGMVWELKDAREDFTLGKDKTKVQKGWVDDV
jgi:hypothetical protein